MSARWTTVILAGVALSAAPATPHGPALAAQGQGREPTLRSSATAVVVDVVVRDRKGAPVTDLTAADFELYEDGVRQTIGAATLATPPRGGRGSVSSTGTQAGITAADASAGTSVTALVFDSLSTEARTAARRAALAVVGGIRADTDRVGVFTSGTPLRTLQRYTSDLAAIRRGVDAALDSALARGMEPAPGRGSLDASTSPTAGAESRGRPDRPLEVTQAEIDAAARPVMRDGKLENLPGLVGDLLVERMTQRMDQAYALFQRDGFGHGTTASLLAIVTSLAPLPGRKSVIFVAEDFAIPAAAASRFQAIIDTANRANIAVYCIDAAGLRAHSGRAETSREIVALGRRGVGDADRDASQPYTRDLERNEDVLRQDPSASLGLLARHTGGLLIDDTNDLAAAATRIDQDRRFHYLLTYAPANTRFAGEYRRIEVRVPGRRVEVRARPGYVATAASSTGPTLRYEAEALAALAGPRLPTEIRLRARTLTFPRTDDAVDVAVLLSLTAGDAGHWVDRATQRYRTDFTMLARLTDAQGRVVWSGSQPYVLAGAVADVERARGGDVLFFRQTTLPPGTYTLEFVVHDALTQRAGAGRETLVIDPVSPGRLAAGSLVMVRQVEPMPADEGGPVSPFHAGNLLLTPNVGEPVRRSHQDRLLVFLHVRPAGAPVRARLELRRLDVEIASLPLEMPSPAGNGDLRYLATLALGDVAPGPCELRLHLDDGRTAVTRTAGFILDP